MQTEQSLIVPFLNHLFPFTPLCIRIILRLLSRVLLLVDACSRCLGYLSVWPQEIRGSGGRGAARLARRLRRGSFFFLLLLLFAFLLLLGLVILFVLILAFLFTLPALLRTLQTVLRAEDSRRKLNKNV